MPQPQALTAEELEALLPYAMTDTQRLQINACITQGSQNKAAKFLGVNRRAIDKTIVRVKARAALKGWSPEHDLIHPVADPFITKGNSILYGRDGKPIIQWVKTTLDGRKLEQMIRDAIETMIHDVKGLSPYIPPPKFNNDDLMCVYPMGDPHFGMHA